MYLLLYILFTRDIKINLPIKLLIYFFIRIQAGKYHEALELLKTALKIEEKELGARRHRMVELFALMAEIYDEVCFITCHIQYNFSDLNTGDSCTIADSNHF